MSSRDLKERLAGWLEDIRGASSSTALEKIKLDTIGKSGFISEAFAELATLDKEGKKRVGESLNTVKTSVEEALRLRLKELEKADIAEKLKNESVDVTLPVEDDGIGGLHVLTQLFRRIKKVYRARGFLVVDGPEIEDEFHNFDALNIPEDHPARQSQDTFYVDGFDKILLRTHTSPVQIRTMIERGIPVRMISIGRTYRNDQLDSTHSPMFHQIEELVVDYKPISVGNLKHELKNMLAHALGVDLDNIRVRLRPSYFSFTEPGMEVDCYWSGKWLEIAGAGMVHPGVLEKCGITKPAFGFAFAFGLERLVMLKNGIVDIRELFEADKRWLRYYGRVA
jgi:phenylalanyl-tRNA synthetase alpha chain